MTAEFSFFYLASSTLHSSLSLFFFWPVARSTSRCRQLTTCGLGCDHKRINPSGRTGGIRRRCLVERSRMADESRRGASTREQCRGVYPHLLFFFRQSHLDHEHDLPGRERSRLRRLLYSVPISRSLEGTIDRPSWMNAILSQFSSTFVVQRYFFFFLHISSIL